MCKSIAMEFRGRSNGLLLKGVGVQGTKGTLQRNRI